MPYVCSLLLIVAVLLPQCVLGAGPREVLYTPVTSSITPVCDTTDVVVVNTMAGPLTIQNPVWRKTKPVPSQTLTFRLFSLAPQPLTWGAEYSAAAGLSLPTATTGLGGTYDYLRFMRNSVTGKWDLVANTIAPTAP